MLDSANVAPRVGAWIETGCPLLQVLLSRSHPVWVRGLKLPQHFGAKTACVSHPVWVRGLKHSISKNSPLPHLSHPVWVRGLKHLFKIRQFYGRLVAPRVGAWIETYV